jgi:hypothetical protein
MQVAMNDLIVSLPMPIFLVVEDVGWWQGTDGSANNEPYRNGFTRRHCLDDYRALARLARRLKMRIALGMVLGEWDRGNLLKDVAGATWMGHSWDNRINQGPWLDEAAQYLRDRQDCLEIACHGLCHEFWRDGRMERSEFHDQSGLMRPRKSVKKHLDAFAKLLVEYNLSGFPRLFLPPALHHSFGNGQDSIQAILHDYGISYVVTAFSRARRYSEPLHEKITWECGVGLLERGFAPVPWHEAAARPAWDFQNPILPLHWSNLLHSDPEKNFAVVDAWAKMLENKANTMAYMLAADIASCWSQAAAYHLVKMAADDEKITLDLRLLETVPGVDGSIFLKIQCPPDLIWQCRGGHLVSCRSDPSGIETVRLRPIKGQHIVLLHLCGQ